MRPIAERIKAGQDAADLQSYNRRFDTLKQVSESMEQLQTGRKESDLPAAPTLEPGGDPDLWRSAPVAVTGPSEAEQLVPELHQLEANIDREAYEAAPPKPDWDDL